MARTTSKSDPAHARIALLIGENGVRKLRAARVAVFGAGAVGSFAIEALARSGVGFLRIIDFDEVRLSNLNRQLYALRSTVGKSKAALAAARVADLNPACEVDARPEFFAGPEADEHLGGGLDFVIDAIDSMNPKVSLICAARERCIPIISSMGAAGRTDPTRVRVTDLNEVVGDPLSKIVRKKIHRRGVRDGVDAVWTTERMHRPPEEPEAEEELFERGRPRAPLPSMVFVPAAFGMAAAHHVVKRLLARR